MNVSSINNSTNFNGTLSRKVVKHIKKAEKKDLVSMVRLANKWGEVITAETINTKHEMVNGFIETLTKLAQELPQKASLVIEENIHGVLYIKGNFSDKYTKKSFSIFRNFGSEMLTDSCGNYRSIEYLKDNFSNIQKSHSIKSHIFSSIENAIETKINKGKINSENSLQKVYDYYKEEFSEIDVHRKKHMAMIEDYKNKKAIADENLKYLPLGKRILVKLGL